jgi:AcrR family transcriptional regulator
MTSPRKEQERSRVTRQRLMEACVECLVELGWAGTTTTVVAQRAGVSRGAQLHHYPTRAELVVAAVEHVGRARAAEIVESAGGLPAGPRRTEAALGLLAGFYCGPLFAAALELWVAARTDEQLRVVVAPLETQLGREAHKVAVELLGADEARPGVRELIQATLDLLRGLGLAGVLSDDRERRLRILRRWARVLDGELREYPQGV